MTNTSNVSLTNALAQRIPNWQTLFGSTSFCQCEECRSIYGAAAYFVDLLEFLRKSGANDSGFRPFDVLVGNPIPPAALDPDPTKNLLGRRPDLPHIKLNCQNTNTLIPYVDLVNEVLESYIANSGTLDASTAHNTPSDATADELSVNPEYTAKAAYDKLDGPNVVYPMTLPFNGWIETARTYLEFLGSSRYEVMKQFGTQSGKQDKAAILAAEFLKMDEQEYSLITGQTFATGVPAPATATNLLYGYASPGDLAKLSAVPEFLARTQTEYKDLVALLNTQYLNPSRSITLKIQSSDPNPDPCDITQTAISPMDEPTTKKFYPFLRLWKKLGWTISDLDAALTAVAPTGINRGFILAAAQLKELQSSLNLPLSQLLTLWSDINVDGRDSLYVSLFQNKAVANPVDTAFQLKYLAPLAALPAAPYPASVTKATNPVDLISYDSTNHLLCFVGAMTDEQREDLLKLASADANTILAVQTLYHMRWYNGTELNLGSEPLSLHVNTILSALRITASDLDAIRTAANLGDTTTTTAKLSLKNLSTLYRYALLARALGISIPDLISLITLTGTSPFGLAPGDPVTDLTMNFVKLARTVLDSKFSVAQLNYVYRAISDPANGLGPLESDLEVLLLNLQTGLGKIAASNTFAPDPTGAVLRQKLGVVAGNKEVASAISLIKGTATYAAPLSALPLGVSIPAALSAQISYDSGKQQLQCIGVMTDSAEAQLVALAPTDGPYIGAVNSLHEQPRDIIKKTLSFLDPNEATAELITSPSPNVSDRYNYVLAGLLAFLQESQSESLVKQTLSQALALDPATTALFLSGIPKSGTPAILKSQADPTQPAMVDFLGGLLVSYFSDENLSVAASQKVESGINLGTGGATPPAPFSVRWTGKIMPQSRGKYTLYVNANDGVRLWVDGKPLVSQWTNQAVNEHVIPDITLNAGQLYDIKLEYYSTLNTPVAQLSWSSPAIAKSLIPQSALFPVSPIPTLLLLYRIALLVSTFSMKTEEIAYLSSNSKDFMGVDPGDNTNAVPFDLGELPVDRSNPGQTDKKAIAFFNQWQRLNNIIGLRSNLPPGNVGLFDIFATAVASNSATSVSSGTIIAVLGATGWDKNEFATLIGDQVTGGITIGFNVADADFRNEMRRNGIGLLWLRDCLALSARLGVSTGQLFTWANADPSRDQAHDIQNTVKAKFDDATWINVGKPLNNKLREKSKAALISYILTMPNIVQLGIANSNQLYEYFLIDVDMSSCMQTSRIVQANAAIQLFVQRCLMNLENNNSDPWLNVLPDAIDAGQWEWRKNYRVWEANRMVLLYPEIVAESALRDNKTTAFKELESELQQKEITNETVEEAYRNYLQKLEEVSRLKVTGLFSEVDKSIHKDVLHVFARTFSSPHVYYYRQLDNSMQVWSPWQKVDVEIEGDHLMPVVWNRRLFIFWPTFKETADPKAQASSTGMQVPDAKQQDYTTPPARKTLEVKLAWSEYKQGKWTKKQTTNQSLTPGLFDDYTDTLDTSKFTFNAITKNGNLLVSLFSSFTDFGPPLARRLGTFTFGGCKSDGQPSVPDVFKSGAFRMLLLPGTGAIDNVTFDGLTLKIPHGDILNIANLLKSSVLLPLFLPGAGVIDNMDVLVKEENLTLKVANPSTINGSDNLVVLDRTPNFFELVFPQQTFPDDRLSSSSPPFFYQDDRRTYFVTETVGNVYSGLQNPSYARPSYERTQLVLNETFFNSAGAPVLDSQAVTAGSTPQTRFAQPETRTLQMEMLRTTGGGAPSAGSATGADSSSTSTISFSGNRIGGLYAPGERWKEYGRYYYFPQTAVEFHTHYHPHVCDFIQALNWKGIPGLLTLENQQLISGDTVTETAFHKNYSPEDSVATPYPAENVDFLPGGAYSIYNWELFFHIPLLIATKLSQNQKFEDAQKWFHYIFNPTSNSKDAIPKRYWNFFPFYKDKEEGRIQNLLASLDYTGTDPAELTEKAEMISEIKQWAKNPFNPHLICRMRIISYQKNVVMKYIDNLLAAGDYLYSRYTRESVAEATQLYVLARDILGDQPVQIPPQGTIVDKTYNDLLKLPNGIDDLSNGAVHLENEFPFSGSEIASGTGDSGGSSQTTLLTVPYFCTPPNNVLLGYWTTVAKRLFNIRHCLNIKGIAQPLPLFAPSINPALLVQAVAMGLDLTSALNDINAATPYYRFTYIVQKAFDVCAEVRALGGTLLSALEKKDAEHISLLRASQETALLKAVLQVKKRQLDEANATLAGLQNSRAVTDFRRTWYQNLISTGLNAFEKSQVSALTQAQVFQQDSQAAELLASELALIPNFDIGASGFGASPIASATFGGAQLAGVASAVGRMFGMMAAAFSHEATMASLMGGWDRRAQDWNLQMQMAALELAQIDKQILAAQIRSDIAQKEIDNHQLQIDNTADVEDFLRSKYTNEDLYDWMISKISGVFFQCYQLAYDLAKRAEACFRFELGLTDSNYIQFGYWDNLKQGLLSGEQLYLDLKRLETAYLDQNKRELEITKSVSLVLLDPIALITLKETGQCIVNLHEALFDIDYAGHYMRRMKGGLSLTIPCVTGPYTSVNCTLTLLSNKTRVDSDAVDIKDYASDSHFVLDFAATQSIATSSAQNDSGLFEVNFHDERYLPFEGAGVISTWLISLPKNSNAFDFESISDVIVNLKYTARDGGVTLRDIARQAAVMPGLAAQPAPDIPTYPAQPNLTRYFSLKHEFPTDWYKFLHPADQATSQSMAIALSIERFPYIYRGKKVQISQVELFLKFKDMYDRNQFKLDGTPLGDYGAGGALSLSVTPPRAVGKVAVLSSVQKFLNGVPHASVPQTLLPNPPPLGLLGTWTLGAAQADIQKIAKPLQNVVSSGGNNFSHLNPDVIDDIFFVCRYSAG